jgi:putative resolvase
MYKFVNQKEFTVSEAAELLGVSAKTLRRWDEEGKLKPRRTEGNQRRYDLEDLRPLLEQKAKRKIRYDL